MKNYALDPNVLMELNKQLKNDNIIFKTLDSPTDF